LLPIDYIVRVMTAAEFGAALRRRRRELNLAQEDVANVIGVNRRVIGELERGKTTVQLKIALEAASAVGLDIHLKPRGR
jgi:DNA-binding XRE family transcriptional regulator